MITNYNYATNQLQTWYSEEEYNELLEKYKEKENEKRRVDNNDE